MRHPSTRVLKILIAVPGEAAGRALAQAVLRADFDREVEVAQATTVEEVWQLTRDARPGASAGRPEGWRSGPDVAILSLSLPSSPTSSSLPSGPGYAAGESGPQLADGLDMMARLKRLPSRPEIVALCDERQPGCVEQAFAAGAWEAVEVPARFFAEGRRTAFAAQIALRTASAVERAASYVSEREDRAGQEERAAARPLDRRGVVGESQPLLAALDAAAEAAASEANVLITGESGTGKELFARLIHANSGRAGGPFVVVDCASLPWTLAESELFGHVRGAFTGADRPREGLLKLADGGTLFLDELGELPLSAQKIFLRALEERRFRPLGGEKELTSDFRLLAATNRDLEAMVERGAFRSDLLYRTRAISIHLPPLRERTGDVPLLARRLAQRRAERFGGAPPVFSPDFLETLEGYAWPGNVREFVNAMERAFTAAGSEGVLYPTHLPVYIRTRVAQESLGWDRGGARRPSAETEDMKAGAEIDSETDESAGSKRDRKKPRLPTLKAFREAQEKSYLRELLLQSQTAGQAATGRESTWNADEASRISGMSRARLYALLKKHGFLRRWAGAGGLDRPAVSGSEGENARSGGEGEGSA